MQPVPKRLAVKFGLARATSLQPGELTPIFQRWIQHRNVPGMLIDVIDYKHVPDGPGIMLIADEADYAWDLGDDAVGLRYIRKRALPDDLGDALRLCFEHAHLAAKLLESEAPGEIEFDYSAAEVSYLDRLLYPNHAAVAETARRELAAVLREVFDGDIALTWLREDPREVLTLRCESSLPLRYPSPSPSPNIGEGS